MPSSVATAPPGSRSATRQTAGLHSSASSMAAALSSGSAQISKPAASSTSPIPVRVGASGSASRTRIDSLTASPPPDVRDLTGRRRSDLVARQELAPDDHALDLRRALADEQQRRVAVEALDLVLLGV